MNGTATAVTSVKSQKAKIGVMGGSFDPIHYGHLVLAEEVRQHFGLERVIFIPVGKAPHKPYYQMAEDHQRYEMVRLATLNNPFFEVSRMEMDSEETSYTVHTLEKLKAFYGDETALYFITGADTLLDLQNWYMAERLLQLCTFVGATRPGYVSEALTDKAAWLRETYLADIQLIAIPGLAISSTEIRERIQQGITVKYLLPDAVEAYIKQEGLYV